MTSTNYKIRYTYSARDDVAGIKKYILSHFKYHQLVVNFKKKMLKAEKGLTTFPSGYEPSGFVYRGYTIFMKPESTYLIFLCSRQAKQNRPDFKSITGWNELEIYYRQMD